LASCFGDQYGSTAACHVSGAHGNSSSSSSLLGLQQAALSRGRGSSFSGSIHI
jgi:hypothetical protein